MKRPFGPMFQRMRSAIAPSLFILAICSLLYSWGCSGDPTEPDPNDTTGQNDTLDTTDTTGQTDTTDTTATITPRDTAAMATYSVTIYNDWSETLYPSNYPEDAHFSHLGGATHNDQVSFWSPGTLASAGMTEMAETGNVHILVEQEVAAAVSAGNADVSIYDTLYTPEKPALPPGSRTRMLTVHRTHPLVTMVTMLGPSPDWFVGLSRHPLYVNGKWIEGDSIELPLYDGGTKDGVVPVMGGPDTEPQSGISYVRYDPILGLYEPTTTPMIVGRIVFKRID